MAKWWTLLPKTPYILVVKYRGINLELIGTNFLLAAFQGRAHTRGAKDIGGFTYCWTQSRGPDGQDVPTDARVT